jgi:hypothetical protein
MSGRLACLLALLCLSLTACEGFSFFPDRSKLAIEPYAAMLKPSGSASMQSVVGPGPVDQPSVDLGDGLNLVDRQFSYGALFNYGDNFAGLELGFSYWEHTNVTTDGSLDYDFGELDQGDDVQTYARWQRYHIGWLFPLLEQDIKLARRSKLELRLAGGAELHHNELRLRSEAQNAARQQSITAKDDLAIPLISARFEAEYEPFKLRLDLAGITGEFGDFDGRVLDSSITLHYQVQRDVSIYGGLWRYDLPARGDEDGLRYDVDMRLSGYMVGLRWEF